MVENQQTTPLRLTEIKLEKWCASITSVAHPRLGNHASRFERYRWKFHVLGDRYRKNHFETFNNCPPILVDAVAEVIAKHNIDLVWVNYVKLAGVLKKIPAHIPILCDTHDVQFIREKRLQIALGQTWNEGREYKEEEMKLLARFPYLLAITETDRDYLAERFGTERVFYMPLTVPTVDTQASDSTGPILFVGAARMENELAMKWFLKLVFPLVRHVVPEARVQIVGGMAKKFKLWEEHGVDLIPYAPVLEPHFEEASCCIAPILAGGGVKVKIIEALAAKRSVIITTIGAEGIPVEHLKNAWVADSPKAFAEGVCSILKNEKLRHKLEKNGRKLFDSEYSATICRQKIDTILDHIFSAESGPSENLSYVENLS